MAEILTVPLTHLNLCWSTQHNYMCLDVDMDLDSSQTPVLNLMTLDSTWDLDLDFDLETHDLWPHLDLKARQFCRKMVDYWDPFLQFPSKFQPKALVNDDLRFNYQLSSISFEGSLVGGFFVQSPLSLLKYWCLEFVSSASHQHKASVFEELRTGLNSQLSYNWTFKSLWLVIVQQIS